MRECDRGLRVFIYIPIRPGDFILIGVGQLYICRGSSCRLCHQRSLVFSSCSVFFLLPKEQHLIGPVGGLWEIFSLILLLGKDGFVLVCQLAR